MRNTLMNGLFAAVAAGTCIAPAHAFFSATGPVIAILADELYLGEAVGYLTGSGTLTIQSQKNAAVSCRGEFTSSAELGGKGQLKCSDGATGTFQFERLTVRRGHGDGSTTRGAMSFTYGLTLAESVSYLKVPAGKRLVQGSTGVQLIEIAPAPAATVTRPAIRVGQAAGPAQPALLRVGASAGTGGAQAGTLGAPAALVAPDVLLNTVTSEVIALIRKDTAIQNGNPAKVAELVETRILQHFDFERMTQIVMARNWRAATPEQQQALTLEFKTLLVRTYSTALSRYRDQVIDYRPLRAPADAVEVTVRSDVRQAGAERMTIDYDMQKTAGGWKVFDIKISGVSMVTAYRDTFAGRVRDGGIDGLIKSLTDKNRQDAART